MSNRRKIIIHIDAGLTDETATACVSHVIDQGRISRDGQKYCYCTTFRTNKGPVIVWAREPNATGTQRFDVLVDGSTEGVK